MCKTSQNSEDLRYNCTLPTGRHRSAHKHKMGTEMGLECIHLVQTGPVDSAVPSTQGFLTSACWCIPPYNSALCQPAQSPHNQQRISYSCKQNGLEGNAVQYRGWGGEGGCFMGLVSGHCTVRLLTVPHHCLPFALYKENPHRTYTFYSQFPIFSSGS